MNTSLTEKPVAQDRVVVSSRVFPASCEHLFGTFADPDCLARWWGPKGFTNTIHEFDLKAGGHWRFEMHGPDGAVYRQDKQFLAVDRPSRLALRHAQPTHQFDLTISFDEVEGGTRLTWRMEFASLDEKTAAFIAQANEENFDRLEQELASIRAAAEDRDFVIDRIIAAPRDRVWSAWTQPELLTRWWGPRSFGNPLCEVDLRPAGPFYIVMQCPDGVDYPLKGIYREVAAPERLVLSLDCSEHPPAWQAAVNHHSGGDSPDAAGEVLLTTHLESLSDRTRLIIRQRFESSAIRNAMLDLGMEQAWSQSLDRLERSLLSPAK